MIDTIEASTEEKVKAITYVYAFDESYIPENPRLSPDEIYEKFNLKEKGIERFAAPDAPIEKSAVKTLKKSVVWKILNVIGDALTHSPFIKEEY